MVCSRWGIVADNFCSELKGHFFRALLLCLPRFGSALSACSLKWVGDVSVHSLARRQNMVKTAFMFDTFANKESC